MSVTDHAVTIHNPQKAFDGFTLFTPHYGYYTWLVDNDGRVVHYWKTDHVPGGDVRLLPNGNLLRLNRTLREPLQFFGSVSTELVELDWEGKVVWKYENPYLHHDFCRLDNGNTLLNLHVLMPRELVSRVQGGIKDTELMQGMWDNAFREITPTGEVVWDWLGYEHQDTEMDVICPLCPRTIWNYVNGMDVYGNGDIVASFRHFNTIAIIDRQDGRIQWRWGAKELGHHHNPTLIGNRNVLVFDNGYHNVTSHEVSDSCFSRVLEVNPETNKIEWEYKDDNANQFYSGICSGAERLPNGNTLICESTKGRIFEVTPNLEIVWEFVSPFFYRWGRHGLTNLIFRAHRYGCDFQGLKGKDLDPDRFEWVIRKKGGPEESIHVAKDEEAVKKRLQQLGY